MRDADKLKDIIERHSDALKEELKALYGEDAGFVIVAGLMERKEDRIVFRTTGNLTPSIACLYFEKFVQDHKEVEVMPIKSTVSGKLH